MNKKRYENQKLNHTAHEKTLDKKHMHFNTHSLNFLNTKTSASPTHKLH